MSVGGLKPPTSGIEGQDSNKLSYRLTLRKHQVENVSFFFWHWYSKPTPACCRISSTDLGV